MLLAQPLLLRTLLTGIIYGPYVQMFLSIPGTIQHTVAAADAAGVGWVYDDSHR